MGGMWKLTGAAKGSLHKWYHMQKRPLGFKNSWAGSVSLSWIWFLDLLEGQTYISGWAGESKCSQLLISTLHKSSEGLEMIFSFLFVSRQQGAACKSWTNISMGSQNRTDVLCCISDVVVSSIVTLNKQETQKNREDGCFSMAVPKQIKTSTNSPSSPSPYQLFFGNWIIDEWDNVTWYFYFCNLWKISCYCLSTLVPDSFGAHIILYFALSPPLAPEKIHNQWTVVYDRGSGGSWSEL